MERLTDTMETKGKAYNVVIIAEAGKAQLSYQLICAWFINPSIMHGQSLRVSTEVRDGRLFVDLKDNETLFGTAVLIEH